MYNFQSKSFLLKNFLMFFLFISLKFAVFSQEETASKDKLNSEILSGLKFRSIGPAYASGRIADIEINPYNFSEQYIGVAAGNVWKTSNAGITYEPIFDSYGSYSIADVAIDPRNTNVVWIGTGEYNSQRAIGYGDGIYLSLDGGKSFKNKGLTKTEHIGRVVIDPRNSHVYVAAQGPLWGAGGERGLYKTTDMGETWTKILNISDNTGVTDIIFDPRNPDILYCASYQRERKVYTLVNGGPESSIYKSEDAGKTWRKLTNGLPAGDKGRIGLAISSVNPDYVFAIVEAEKSAQGFFRSKDRGESWTKESNYMSVSPQYYNRIYCDPIDKEKVYSTDTYSQYTLDGGKTWTKLGLDQRHVDDHTLWINPTNTKHLIIGGDGGIYDSFDGGIKWRHVPNLPVTQFYRVGIDNAFPFYNVSGGTQDNNSMVGPSQTTNRYGILNSDWTVTQGGDGFFTAFDTKDPNIMYAEYQYGGLTRFDRLTEEGLDIRPQEPQGEIYRWNWNAPFIISNHSNTRLYFAANKLFKSDNRGNSWEVISPDLTRAMDRNKLKVMGIIQSPEAIAKSESTSLFGNIVSLTESPLNENILYTGSDDGLIQVTTDGGKNWSKYEKFAGVPDMTYISCLLASQHEQNTVYASFDGRKNNDFKPYIYKSTDNGKTWKSITSNLPERGTVYSIAEDFEDKNLLFAGTEFGIFFTVNGGEKWIQLKSGIPTIAIHDIKIQKRECDLVLATFGRGFYILDDYSALRKISEQKLDLQAILFPVQDALMFVQTDVQYGQGVTHYGGENPKFGAVFTYYLKETVQTKKQIRIENEKKLRKENKEIPYPTEADFKAEADEIPPFLLFEIKDMQGNIIRTVKTGASKGIQRVNWGLMSFSSSPVLSDKSPDHDNQSSGMPVLPGKYTVTMFKVQNGEKTKLSEMQEFNAKTFYQASIPNNDTNGLYVFQQKTSETYRVSSALVSYLNETEKRVKSLQIAFENSKFDSSNELKQINNILLELKNLKIKLNGDDLIANRNEGQTPSVNDRVINTLYGIWRSFAEPTETMKINLKIAQDGLKEISEQTKILVKKIEELENISKERSNPFSIGIIPELKNE